MEGNNKLATEKNVIVLNRLVECSKKGFRLVSISFLIVSMAMVVTLINKEYYYDRPWDHDNVYMVASIDYLNDMHNRLTYGGHGGGGGGSVITMTSSSSQNNNNNNENGHEIVLAQLDGESAQKITKALHDGTMIKFNVFDDGSLVELVQEIENNIPDDKRTQTLKSI